LIIPTALDRTQSARNKFPGIRNLQLSVPQISFLSAFQKMINRPINEKRQKVASD
jgi:hypothetical protein